MTAVVILCIATSKWLNISQSFSTTAEISTDAYLSICYKDCILIKEKLWTLIHQWRMFMYAYVLRTNIVVINVQSLKLFCNDYGQVVDSYLVIISCYLILCIITVDTGLLNLVMID